MSSQKTLEDSRSVTSSQGLVDGAQQPDLLDGMMTDQCGQEAHPASHSVQPGTGKEKTISSDISGRCSLISSASAALQLSLENRLRQQLEWGGSTIYKKIWKQKVTPAQWSYSQLAASVPRTKEIDSSMSQKGWATPNTMDHMALRSDEALLRQETTIRKGRTFPNNLREQVDPRSQEIYATGKIPAAWPTPSATCRETSLETMKKRKEFRKRNANQNTVPMYLPDAVQVMHSKEYAEAMGYKDEERAAWPTPTTRDYKDTGDLSKSMIRKDGKSRCDSVPRVASTIGAARMITSGQEANTYIAEMGKSVKYQLNPRFSLWLMGYPIEWAHCAERVTPLSRKSRQK